MTDNITNGGNIEEREVDSVIEGDSADNNENANANNEAVDAGATETTEATDAAENISAENGEQSFAEMLDRTFATLSRGDRVKGTISYISDGEIHVDLGFKYTGVLAFDEVTDDSSVDLKEMFKVGDEIETQIIKTNDQEGIALLSKKRVDSNEIWDKIVKLHEDGTVVEGKVIQVVNGGIIVLIDSMRVFVPASHADVTKDTDLQTLVGKTVKVKIIDINAVKRRAIASIRNASAEARKAVEEKVWSEIEHGKKYEGVVKSITNYGVFVDIGGVDGMIHRSELSWIRIKHPSEVLQSGDKIEVYIKDFDMERRRIALGYRDENENPWTKFTEERKVGDVVDAKILNMMPFGAFAEIVPGVDGLIHISQIVDKKISKPSEILNIGDIVQVKITEINAEAKKISLSMRALIEPEQGPQAIEGIEVTGGEEEPAEEVATEPEVIAPVEETPAETSDIPEDAVKESEPVEVVAAEPEPEPEPEVKAEERSEEAEPEADEAAEEEVKESEE